MSLPTTVPFELFEALKELLIEKYDNIPERHIIEEYESLA